MSESTLYVISRADGSRMCWVCTAVSLFIQMISQKPMQLGSKISYTNVPRRVVETRLF